MRALLAAISLCAVVFFLPSQGFAQTLISESYFGSPQRMVQEGWDNRHSHPRSPSYRVASRGPTSWREPKPVHQAPMGGWFAGGNLIGLARSQMGMTGRQLGMRHLGLWCAEGLNKWLVQLGYPSTGSAMAGSFLTYGRPSSGPQVGAIAIIGRGRYAQHVGIVTGIDPSGNPIIVSANHGNRVGEGVYPARTIMAYRSL